MRDRGVRLGPVVLLILCLDRVVPLVAGSGDDARTDAARDAAARVGATAAWVAGRRVGVSDRLAPPDATLSGYARLVGPTGHGGTAVFVVADRG